MRTLIATLFWKLTARIVAQLEGKMRPHERIVPANGRIFTSYDLRGGEECEPDYCIGCIFEQ